MMKRRDFLKYTGGFASLVAVDSVLARVLFIPTAHGSTVPLDTLEAALDPKQAIILADPNNKKFKETLVSSNLRTQITPTVRVLCLTPEAVGICILWAKQNGVPMAMRNGGHSYEGFSQSTGIVIDVRMMDSTALSKDEETLTAGGGAILARCYLEVAKKGRVIPAGSCPTVGATGHTTGGGYGVLARPFGLACDSLKSAEMVNAQGQLITLNEKENADLFWAIRGAGSGSFGIITKLEFQTHKAANVTTFVTKWEGVSKKTATQLFKAWQAWAPNAPNGITSIFKFVKNSAGQIIVSLNGQTVNSAKALKTEFDNNFFKIKKPTSFSPKTQPFIDAVAQFSGDKAGFATKNFKYPAVYMKGKSDYLKKVIDDSAYDTIFDELPIEVFVIFDSYGGQIRAKKDTDTAFAHRENTIASVQYYAEWSDAANSAGKIAAMNEYYEKLRDFMSGGAYFNYCDLDIENYAERYWGVNLPRLVDIKNAHDPENFFKHAQSVPLKIK